ncbi:ribonuclease H-like domain-containing protein [Tanacetum coccineum]|uniref:Ribonuclease H-like domain-containing protein n=1 Tax=Tanacetum coccineum TaxID=301880 RepID=A0ABQ5HA17_9ASTR
MPSTPDLSFTGLDEFVNKPVVKNCKAMSSEEEPKVVRKNDDAPIIEEWVSDDEKEDVSQPKIEKKTVRPNIVKKETFGCPVTILNTIDHLGKFDGKANEGFFVGYSLNSKAFRVFNNRTRIVEENFYIRFSKSTPNVIGSGPDWLFDNEPNVSQIVEKVDEDPRKESECNDQEKEDNVNNTNNVNAASTNEGNDVGGKTSIELLDDPNMHALEDYSIFDFSRDDEDDGAVADINNLDRTIQVNPISTTRIHKDH